MLKLKFFFLLIMSSELYSSAQVNHEHPKRKHPLLRCMVRESLTIFVFGHCIGFLNNNLEAFLVSSKTKTYKEKFELISKALRSHEFTTINLKLVAPTIVALAITKGTQALLKKFI